MEICDTVSETRRVAKSLRFPEDLQSWKKICVDFSKYTLKFENI